MKATKSPDTIDECLPSCLLNKYAIIYGLAGDIIHWSFDLLTVILEAETKTEAKPKVKTKIKM